MTVPRTVDEILQHADALAGRFEDYGLREGGELDAGAVALLRASVAERAEAERHIVDAVRHAREAGLSWSAIGGVVGTSGEAARQRYSSRLRSALRRCATEGHGSGPAALYRTGISPTSSL
jgi:hypothetical protein